MIVTEHIQTELEQNTQQLVDALLKFNADNFNRKPLPTSWSAAEVADHVLSVTRFSNKALLGSSQKSERPYDEKLKVIKWAMGDTNAKYKSPEMALPKNGLIDQTDAIGQLRMERKSMSDCLKGIDLSQFSSDFKHPGFGGLTKFEWIHFDMLHVKRHIVQIENVLGSFG
jgi:hypothetical protein